MQGGEGGGTNRALAAAARPILPTLCSTAAGRWGAVIGSHHEQGRVPAVLGLERGGDIADTLAGGRGRGDERARVSRRGGGGGGDMYGDGQASASALTGSGDASDGTANPSGDRG